MPRPVSAATLVLVLLAVLPGGAAPASAGGGVGTSWERRLHALVNGARSKEGLAGLDLRGGLTRKAHRHSRRMAAQGRLFHQSSSAFPPGTWGENVAQARGVRRAHRMLMKSPSHRENILCGCFDRIGLGVVRRGGWYWVTEMFVG